MIALIDYGLGNIQALANIYKRIDIPVCFAKSPIEMEEASHLILPGIGAFDWAIERLHASGMLENLIHLVLVEKKPVLGICVGMQMMAKNSDEGNSAGLGWFDAHVKRFDEEQLYDCNYLPHMGWNSLSFNKFHPLFKDINSDDHFYFVHSYEFDVRSKDLVIATTSHGKKIVSSVAKDNIIGLQFHPEKSQVPGLKIIKNFIDWKPEI